MKTRISVRLAPIVALVALLVLTVAACVSPASPGAVTTSQQMVANGVEDLIAIGLVPVLTKNPGYLQEARFVATAIGDFKGDSLSPEVVAAFLDRTSIKPEDARTVAALVNSAWAIYARRYSGKVDASVRPDVKLFLSAISRGINAAVAAVPPR